MQCNWFLTGPSTPVVGLGGETWSEKQVMRDSDVFGGGLDGTAWPCPGCQHLQLLAELGRCPVIEQRESFLRGFLEGAAWGFHLQLWTTEPGSRVVWHHGTWLCVEACLLVVATPGCQSLGCLDSLLDCQGTWNSLVDFCHFFASPSCGNY